MPDITLTISVPETDETDRDAVGDVLDKIQQLELEHAVDINVPDLKWKHSDWDWDAPCPECGSELFHCSETEYVIYELVGDNLQFQSRADPGPELQITSVMCDDDGCLAQLYRGPASFLSE